MTGRTRFVMGPSLGELVIFPFTFLPLRFKDTYVPVGDFFFDLSFLIRKYSLIRVQVCLDELVICLGFIAVCLRPVWEVEHVNAFYLNGFEIV